MRTDAEIKALAEQEFPGTTQTDRHIQDVFIHGYVKGQKESRWIKCSERLPEAINKEFGSDEHVLVVYKGHVYIGRFVNLGQGKYHWGISHISSPDSLDIIAWQPMPEVEGL